MRWCPTVLTSGQMRDQARELFTSLPADPARRPARSRGHWAIENICVHVKDDSFGEDRHVVQRHQHALRVSSLHGTARTLVRPPCPLWPPTAPMTAPAEWTRARPHHPRPTNRPGTTAFHISPNRRPPRCASVV